jgi:hypothetical protein
VVGDWWLVTGDWWKSSSLVIGSRSTGFSLCGFSLNVSEVKNTQAEACAT